MTHLMKSLVSKNKVIYSVVILLIISTFFSDHTHNRAHGEGTNELATDTSSVFIEPFYYEVLKQWQDEGVSAGKGNIEIQAKDFSKVSSDSLNVTNYEGEEEVLLWEEDFEWVEYEVDVQQEGLYELAVEYLPLLQKDGGSRQSVILNVMINGENPYREARSIELRRFYKDQEAKFDEEDNQIRSLIDETTTWNSSYIRDVGVSIAPLKFHFNKGKNTIRLQPQREKLALKSLNIQEPTEYLNTRKLKKTILKQKVRLMKQSLKRLRTSRKKVPHLYRCSTIGIH